MNPGHDFEIVLRCKKCAFQIRLGYHLAGSGDPELFHVLVDLSAHSQGTCAEIHPVKEDTHGK